MAKLAIATDAKRRFQLITDGLLIFPDQQARR
jgi:hypothetical protein